MKKFLAAAGAICLSVGLIGTGAGAASADERDDRDDRVRVVCQHRLCLFVLDEEADSDGDGIPDVDEDALGYDRRDPRDRPETQEVFDLAIGRGLPSFEAHVTELVVLPRDTPDGRALATGLGALDLPERGPVVQSVEGLLDQLRSNGFQYLGNGMTTVLPGAPTMRQDQMLTYAAMGNVATWGADRDSIKGLLGGTMFGLNGQKQATGFVDNGFTSIGGGPGSFGRGYTVPYEDGSRDLVTVISATESTTNKGTVSNVHFGPDGDLTGSSLSNIRRDRETHNDGSSTDDTVIHTTHYDQEGKKTGSTTNMVFVEKSADGKTTTTTTITTQYDKDDKPTGSTKTTTTDDGEKKTTTTTTTTYDDDGKPSSTTTSSECAKADCPETGMYDPSTSSMVVVTPEDWARVAARLDSNRTPSQDDYGQIEPGDHVVVDGLGPLVLNANPDGVVTLAVGGEPFFNSAQPQYGRDREIVIGVSGVSPPSTDPVSWPLN